MLQSFYQAISGMKAMQQGLAVSGNNIANSKTTAYKSRQARFEELIYQQMSSAVTPTQYYAGRNQIEIGTGVKLGSISIDHTQGNIIPTGRKTDLAISGDGYFVVGDNNGNNQKFTRDGSFSLSVDRKLVTAHGYYVLGWNVDPDTGIINTAAEIEPIEINLNQISRPSPTTRAEIAGNLDANSKVGEVVGLQIPVYDTLGSKHNINMNFVKTSTNPNEYVFIATPSDDFQSSASIQDIIFKPSLGIAGLIEKGQYQITTSLLPDGTVDVSVVDPSGNTVLTQNITDTNQTVTLSDGVNDWFTIDYAAGGAPSTAVFQVAEVGTVSFDNQGNISSLSGSAPSGEAQLDFISENTGNNLQVDLTLNGLTGLATSNVLKITHSDGFPAAVLQDFTIENGGYITGYFSDGSVQIIGQVAVATFENPSGLQADGSNYYVPTGNSGVPNIGPAGVGDKGDIVAGSLENSNVDIATELTEISFFQRVYSANSKVVHIGNQILDETINLIR